MANIRGGVFTLRTASRLKKDNNWFALSDVWITSSPPIVTSGLVLNLDAGNTASYPGSGTSWGDLSGISGISTATGALPIYNTTDNGVFKTSGTRTDANASSLVLAIPMDGANNGTTFTDESVNIKGSGSAKSITRFGDTKTSTTQSKFYGSSGFFDGTGDYLSIPDDADFDLGTSNFTIEGFVYVTSASGSLQTFIAKGTGADNQASYDIALTTGGTWVYYLSGNGSTWSIASAVTIGTNVLNTWQHIALVRNGSTFTPYLNGVAGTPTTSSTALFNSNKIFSVGADDTGLSRLFGYIQDLRIYKGVAKYTSNFTPPVPNNGTLVNGPTYSSENGGSIVFDGVDDAISLPKITPTSGASFSAWIYINGSNSNFGAIFANWSDVGGGQAYFIGTLNGTSSTIVIYFSGALIYSITSLPLNTWMLLTITHNGSTSIGYINGIQRGSGASSLSASTNNTSIGYDITRTNYPFKGNISQASIYNRALSAAEVSQNYNALAGRFGLIQERQTVRYSDGSASPNTGYFGGGNPGPTQSAAMDKVTFTSDTTAAVPGANLTIARGYVAATGNSTNGYFGGGIPNPGTPVYSTMDKVTYANDTTAAVPGANLSSTRTTAAATGNSTTGYFGGGNTPGFVSTMDKVTYSSDTTAAVPGANLSSARQALAATGNSTNGYFGGGFPAVSTMDKVTYSSDTTAAVPGANLSIARGILAATGNSTNGYFGGGRISANVATMDKVTYSTDTTAAVPGANLSIARGILAATGNSTNGYFGGGSAPAIVATMDKVTYANDTTAAVPGANLTVAKAGHGASSGRANALPFPPAPTPTPTTSLGNASAPNTGYFGGGITGPATQLSTMDKVTYSTDTTAAVPGAALSSARNQTRATGNSTNGYFGGGGLNTGTLSIMDKVTYASDTTVRVPGANLSSARNQPGATGNSTNGYFGGGYNGSAMIATMDKVTYASDTTAAVPGANLSVARGGVAATGNSTNGYFGGGSATPGTPLYATMDKVTYATDTTAAVPGAALSAARRYLAATGNSTNGYFGGGQPVVATMDKVTYASDTIAAVPGANLSSARSILGATGNSTAGYFGGGNDLVTMDKVTYSSDTTAAVPGANLSSGKRSLGASSARANALPQPTAIVQVPNIV